MNMKKVIAAVLSAAMITTAVPPMADVSAEAAELVHNSFEEDFGTWKARTSGSTEISLSDAQAYEGSKSLSVTGRTVNWNGAGASMIGIMYPDQQYTLSVAVYYDDEVGGQNQQFNLQCLYTDSNGKENYKYISSVNAANGEWSVINGTYTVPSDASNIVVYVEAATLSDFCMDEFIVNGKKTEATDAVDGFSDNFDDGTKMSWQTRGSNTTLEVTDKYAHSGDHSLYTDGRQQLWNGATCNKTLNLTAGGYYSFGCYVLYDGDNWTDTQKFSINLQYDADGKENYYTIATDTANKGEWTHIGTECTIPENASNIYVYVQTAYKPEASVTEQDLMGFYLDDVTGTRLPDPAIQDDLESLNDVYSKYYFNIGCAVTDSELSQGATKDLILKHYGCVTVGNELKPESVLDKAATIAYMNANGGDQTVPQVSLKQAANILSFCQKNDLKVRGHVLVWHSQTPDWFFKENYDDSADFVSPEVMDKRLENYIKNLMAAIKEQYPDLEFYAWDVVNEAASDSGTIRKAGAYSQGDGSSAWVSVYGDQSYIRKAFAYARKYAPAGCKLFYNDYNEYSDAKLKYIQSEILQPIIEDNNIDGMGMQSHIGMSSPTIEQYEAAIRSYAAMGLEVQITELDISLRSNAPEDLLAEAERYRQCFEMYQRVKADGVPLTAVTLWGITDSTSWIGGYPLLFDKDYQAKDAFYAVIDTDAEVQTIKSIPAYILSSAFSTNTSIFEGAVVNEVGDKGTFQVAYDTNGGYLSFLVKGAKGAEVTIMGEGLKTSTSNLPNGSIEVMKKYDGELNEGDSVRFDVVIDGVAWNAQNYDADNTDTSVYGKLTLKKRPSIAEAAKGTPVIDGTIDDIWQTAPSISIDKYSLGNGATGEAKLLWDNDNIYILALANDPVLSKASNNSYEQDTVEVFLDENNHKSTSYEADDIQVRVNYDNEKTVTDGRSTDSFSSAAVKTDGGYLVEIAIPSTLGGFTDGQIVGFDAQINDDGTGDGKRTSIANWFDLSGMGYTDVSGLGLLKLAGKNAKEEVYGDANHDYMVSVADATLVMQYLANPDTYQLSDEGKKLADVEGLDDGVTSSDALTIQKFLAGSILSLPIYS